MLREPHVERRPRAESHAEPRHESRSELPVEFAADVVERLRVTLAASLACWGLSPRTSVQLLNVSENATFLLHDPDAGRDFVARVHREGYSSIDAIRSELAWIGALRAARVVETATALPGVDGKQVQTLTAPGAGEGMRYVVLFEHLPGAAPAAAKACEWFEALGRATALLHVHAQRWSLPPGFARRCWDVDAMVGPHALWGPWRAAVGLTAPGVRVVEAAIDLVRRRLLRFGTGPREFGLIHADLRLANLLVDDAGLRIIDFDDCGFGWFAYDFAAAVSFIEHEASLPALLDAWCVGYHGIAHLSAEAVAEIPTFVVLRRILLTAWLASHPEVPLAQELGATFTAGTVDLADRLLRGTFLSSSET